MGSGEETGSHIFAAELDTIYLKMESVVKISNSYILLFGSMQSPKTHSPEPFNNIIDIFCHILVLLIILPQSRSPKLSLTHHFILSLPIAQNRLD